jgi:hypothetical protein
VVHKAPPGRHPRDLPPWPADAWKGNCRPLSHVAAVRECAFLSEQYRRHWRARSGIVIEFRKVVKVLRAKKVPFVLVGAYGISSWTGRPRATHDVDILVRSGRNHARAVKALREAFPELEVRNFRLLVQDPHAGGGPGEQVRGDADANARSRQTSDGHR